MSRSRLLALMLACGLLPGLAGCGGSGHQSTPLTSLQALRTSCVPEAGHSTFTVGGDVLHNGSSVQVTIDSIRLEEPKNIVQLAQYVVTVPASAHLTLASVDGYPPVGLTHAQQALWERRIPGNDALLSPESSGADTEVVLGLRLRDRGKPASDDGIRVTYTSGGHSYVNRGDLRYEFRPGSHC